MSNNQEIGAPSKGFTITIDLLDLDIKTIEALTTYAHEQCFTLEEAIVNIIEWRYAYSMDAIAKPY